MLHQVPRGMSRRFCHCRAPFQLSYPPAKSPRHGSRPKLIPPALPRGCGSLTIWLCGLGLVDNQPNAPLHRPNRRPVGRSVQSMIARNRRRTVLDGLGLSAAENALHYPAILNRDYGLIGLLAMGTVHKPISAAFLFERVEGLRVRRQQAEDFVIGFDGGDLHWLRGYCNFLSALGELCLAVNGQKGFECSAHLLFEKVETPHTFLLQSRRAFDEHPLNNRETISDAISFLHQLMRLPIKQPARTKAALAHFEAGVAQGKELWKFILAETDDDHEWIPNPQQKGVVGVHVTQEMVDAWRETLDEAEQVLQGKK